MAVTVLLCRCLIIELEKFAIMMGGKEGYFAVMTMDFSLEKAHIKTRLTYKKKQKFVSTLSSYIYPAFYTT